MCPHCGAKVLVEAGEYNCRCSSCGKPFIKRKGRAGAGPDAPPDALTKNQKVQYLFFVSAFSLAAKVAQADGFIAREELRVVEDFMRRQLNLSGEDLKFARGVFDGALGSDEPIEPDKIVSKGLPDEFAGFARRKFDQIQQAYEKISEERGFK